MERQYEKTTVVFDADAHNDIVGDAWESSCDARFKSLHAAIALNRCLHDLSDPAIASDRRYMVFGRCGGWYKRIIAADSLALIGDYVRDGYMELTSGNFTVADLQTGLVVSDADIPVVTDKPKPRVISRDEAMWGM